MSPHDETIRVAGTVRAGERVEVELFVEAVRVAATSAGDRVTVAADGGNVEVDVSSLSLAEREPETHRGTWAELSARSEAALVHAHEPGYVDATAAAFATVVTGAIALAVYLS